MKKMLRKDEELALARAWLDKGCERSRSKLVDSYQPMIRNIARKYLRNGLSMDDLAQEGAIGFMAGLDNFDPDRGYSVGTLARFHIQARIQLHVSEFTGIIRLPNSRRIKGLLSNCVAKIRAAEADRGETLSAAEKAEICAEGGFDLAELEQYEMVMRPTKSLAGRASSSDDESTFELVDEKADTEAEVLASQSMEKAQAALGAIMADMPERTRKILEMRHLGEDFVSLDAIALEVGVSRERVRRIEMDALKKIREGLAASGINSLHDVA
jgi:RNA polymerase sigma factor (sigma-70 family)